MTEGMMVMVGVDGFMFIDMRQESTVPIISFDYLPQLSAEKIVWPELNICHFKLIQKKWNFLLTVLPN